MNRDSFYLFIFFVNSFLQIDFLFVQFFYHHHY